MKTILLLLVLLTCLPTFASEKVKVFWDCSLEGDSVSCIDLKLAYFNNQTLEDTLNPSAADLNLVIRVLDLNNESEYQVTTKWKDGLPLSYPGFRLNTTLSPAELLEKLLVFLKDVTKPYISIANSGAADSSSDKDQPYYISPSANGSALQQQGFTNLSGSAQVIGNYSNKHWRLVGATYAGMNYSNTQKSAFNPGLATNITYFGAGGAVVRSVVDMTERNKGQWNVAIFVNDRTVKNHLTIDGDMEAMPDNALTNTSRKSVIRLGTEWIAVPFLTETSNGNIAVRYSLSGEHHKYIDPASYDYIQETFARHILEVFVVKHFPKVDIGLKMGAFSSSFRNKPLQGVNGAFDVKYKVGPRMTIGASASLQYAQNRVLSTAEEGMNFSGLTSGISPLTYNGSLTITYTLGSIRIFNKEQRWKE